MTKETSDGYLDLAGLASRIYGIIEEQKGSFQLKSTVPYLQLMARYFERVVQAKEEGKYVVGHTVLMPPEIFYAMDIVPLFAEFCSLHINFFSDTQEFLSMAADHGMPPEICSAHRITDSLVRSGAFPRVDSYAYSNQVCDNTHKGGEMMAAHHGTPAYFVDRPYTVTSAASMSYFKEELRGLISFLEVQTGRKMDYDRLQEVVRLSYQGAQLCQQINELRKVVPSPMPAEGAFYPCGVYWSQAGSPEAVSCLEQLRDELKERVAKGIGAVPKERFRILYPFVYPFWDMELLALMEKRYAAVATPDVMQRWGGEWLIDPSDPIGNLARKSTVQSAVYQLHGPAQPWVEDAVQMGREFRADGAIFVAHIGCRQGCAAIRPVKEELQSRLGIPTVIINGDLFDNTFVSRNEVMDKLDGFFEMLEDRDRQ